MDLQHCPGTSGSFSQGMVVALLMHCAAAGGATAGQANVHCIAMSDRLQYMQSACNLLHVHVVLSKQMQCCSMALISCTQQLLACHMANCTPTACQSTYSNDSTLLPAAYVSMASACFCCCLATCFSSDMPAFTPC